MLEFLREKEEQPVAQAGHFRNQNWSADRVAGNVVAVRRAGAPGDVVEVVVGVQILMAVIPVALAVELLLSAFGDDRYGSAGIAPIFGGVIRNHDLQFAHRTCRGHAVDRPVRARVEVGDSIHGHVLLVIARAGYEDVADRSRARGLAPIARVDHASHQSDGVEDVAAAQRQSIDLGSGHRLRAVARGGVDGNSLRRDGDGLGYIARGKPDDAEVAYLAGIQLDIRLAPDLEPGSGNTECEGGGCQIGKAEEAAVIGLLRADEAVVVADQADLRSGHDGTGGIMDGA